MRPSTPVRFPAALCGAALLACAASAQVVLQPPEVVSTLAGDYAFSVAELIAADLDGDEVLDLVHSDGRFLAVSLTTHLGQGDGSFALGVQPALPGLWARAVGDVDGDQQPDLLAASSDFGLALLRGLGDGTFGATEQIPGVSSALTFLADLDGDQQLDIVSSGAGGDLTLRVLLGAGDGSFSSWWSTPKSILDQSLGALADMDGDGSLDLVHAFGPASIQIWYGLDGGADPPTRHLHPFGITPLVDLDVGDVDQDGDLDLIATKAAGITLLINAGPASFTPGILLPQASAPRELLAADVDGDARVDLVFSTEADELGVLRGLGAAAFAPPLHVSHAPRAQNLRVGDVDGAGFPDLLATTQTLVDPGGDSANDVRLLRNHTYAPDAPFLDLGGALPGGAGWPILLAGGDLLPLGGWSLDLANATPDAPAACVLGTAFEGLPFKGGVMLPRPDVVLLSLQVAPDGTLALGGPWPGGVSGAQLWAQWWISDPGGIWGWAASSGVVVTVP